MLLTGLLSDGAELLIFDVVEVVYNTDELLVTYRLDGKLCSETIRLEEVINFKLN